MFRVRGVLNAHSLNGDEMLEARRVRQLVDDDRRDDLEANGGLLRSSSNDIIGVQSPRPTTLNTGSARRTLPAALATKGRTGRAGAVNRLDRVGSGTTWNGVEGRQPNDRREAGVPVAQHRDRPNRTRCASTILGASIGSCQCVARLLGEWRQPVSGRRHQPLRRSAAFGVTGDRLSMPRPM